MTYEAEKKAALTVRSRADLKTVRETVATSIPNCIEFSLKRLYHPWTNGQAERMNRTVKEATIKASHDIDLESLKAHVLAFVSAYKFVKHLQALRWKPPFETVGSA